MLVLKPGDLFATHGSSALSWGIRAAEWWWSPVNEAAYNHVGVIMGSDGATLEARWRFQSFNLRDYVGAKTLIVRHHDMTLMRYAAGFLAVQEDIGHLYPVWRIPLHLFHIGKVFAFGEGVCSEQTAKFMCGAGFLHVTYGITPSDLVERWRIDKDMDIIFEGVLTKDLLPVKETKDGKETCSVGNDVASRIGPAIQFGMQPLRSEFQHLLWRLRHGQYGSVGVCP